MARRPKLEILSHQEPHDDLSRFADWYLSHAPNLPNRPPADNAVACVEGVSGIVLWREGKFQVQMFICPPGVHIPPHGHPNVDSYEAPLTPGIDFLVGGRRTIPRNGLDLREEDHSAWYCMAVRVRPGVVHEAFIGPNGGAFLSIQEWKKGEPTSVGNDWEGAETMGPRHKSQIWSRGYYRPVEESDYAFLAAHMKPADVAEMKALQGDDVDLETLLRESVAVSDTAETGVAADTGEVVSMRGVAPLPGGGGIPWMLSTPRADEFVRDFIVEGRAYVARMIEQYGLLTNYVDVRNTKTIRWLKKIGFTIHHAEPFGAYGRLFHPFTGTRIGEPPL